MAQRAPVYMVFDRPSHAPLALGMLVSYARVFRGGALRDAYDFSNVLQCNASRLLKELSSHQRAVLLFSHYVWNSRYLLELSRVVKAHFPESLTIHGGPHIPKYDYACDEFLQKHPHADIAIRGEGETPLVEALAALADRVSLETVRGLTFRVQGDVVRTGDAPRPTDLSLFPSPYLEGVFDSAAHSYMGGILETNRGCPYGCTFCDWGSLTLQKIRSFPLERIQAEIAWMAKHRLEVIFVADANFGIFPRDLEIAEMIVRAKERTGFPRQVVINYAKNATERVVEIVRILTSGGLIDTGILALQTTDKRTLAAIDRSNIKTNRYVELRKAYDELSLPVSTDLMIGLPGATRASFRDDLQFCFDQRTHARCYLTVLLPNSPMAHRDYRAAHGIRTNANGYIAQTSTCSEDDLLYMDRLYGAYLATVEFGVMRYLLHHLQAERGLRAVDLVSTLLGDLDENRPGLEVTRAVIEVLGNVQPARRGIFLRRAALRLDWDRFYREVVAYLAERYGVADDSALRTLVSVQQALVPRPFARYPKELALAHDVVDYFRDLFRAEPRPLASYPSGSLQISDPVETRWLRWLSSQYSPHRVPFECHSELRVISNGESKPHFLFAPERLELRAVLRAAQSQGRFFVYRLQCRLDNRSLQRRAVRPSNGLPVATSG